MDRASEAARENEQWKPVGSALRTGIIIVDADGQIVWTDDNTRRRMNGGLAETRAAVPEVGRGGHQLLPYSRRRDA